MARAPARPLRLADLGTWSCSFTLGRARAAASFRSGGPTGPTVNRAVCLREHAVSGSGLTLCPRDESGTPLPAGGPILCTGMFNRQRGKLSGISLHRRTGEEIEPGMRTLVEAPFWVQYQNFPVQPAGDYTCRYYAGGELVGELPFTVAP